MNNNQSLSQSTPNRLIHESSLYLKQHAYNPVDWHPWGEEALAKAKSENKPLLISIGYSACHWCHVMEHESFSDAEVADFMNRHFINIKIDREERPDLDQLYMEAVQLLHGHGGWPLNCFALPDGRPFWGATYFQKSEWLQILDQIKTLYNSERETLTEQAERISSGIKQMNIRIEIQGSDEVRQLDTDGLFENVAAYFDTQLGGFIRTPKFPMPAVQRFLLQHYFVNQNKEALDQVVLTLNHMAAGGIYDQVGGGFARYSTDKYWKIPHFEKMLYDNAQLITVYAEAFMLTGQERFREIALETMQFLEREMGSPEHGFSAAIDADSAEGEGSFYAFTLEELRQLLGDADGLLIRYWKAGAQGLWEHNRNILMAPVDEQAFYRENGIEHKELKAKLTIAKSALLSYRNLRPRPAVDPKIITSWNAFVVKAYVNLYRISGESRYLEAGRSLAGFIIRQLVDNEGRLLHVSGGGNKKIPAFADDYSALILALISLHSATLEKEWLYKAKMLADEAIAQFYSEENGLFYFAGSQHEATFAKRQEIHDNVIPSANSMMMEGLFLLGHLFEHNTYLSIVRRAVQGMNPQINSQPTAFCNWARLLLMMKHPFYTLAIAGENAVSVQREFGSQFLPQTLITGTMHVSDLPLLRDRFKPGKTLTYVCAGSECYPPCENTSEAMNYLKPV